jgi:hypothetical protein
MEDWVKSYRSTYNLHRAGAPDYVTSFRPSGDGLEYVELWEIHDRRTGRIKVMATGYDRWLRDEFDGLQTAAGLPFTSLSLTPRTRNFWSTPDAWYLLYHQMDLSDIAVQTTAHRRLSKLKLLGHKSAFDAETLKKLLDGNIGSFIPVAGDFDLSKVLLPFNVPSPNLQLYQDQEVVRRNAREMVGFSQNQIGEFEQTGRRTATEAQIVQQGAGLRLDRRQGQLRRLYTESFQKINNIITQQWKAEKILEVIGDDGLPVWQSIKGEDLKGDYNYKIGFSIGGNETLQERKQTAVGLFMQLLSIPGPNGGPMFDPAALARYLASAFNDPEFSSTFGPGVLNGSQTPQGGQAVPSGISPGAAPSGGLPGATMGAGGGGQGF